jgi:hypothetical protein
MIRPFNILANSNYTIDANEASRRFVALGNVTLLAHVSVVLGGASVKNGTIVELDYFGTGMNISTYSLIIFGVNISAYATSDLKFTAYRIGGAWRVSVTNLNTFVLSDGIVIEVKLANLAVTTGKIGPNAVTSPKLSEEVSTNAVTVEVILDAATKDNTRSIYIPHRYRLSSYYYKVIDTIEATNSATFVVKQNTTTLHTLILTGGTAVGTEALVTIPPLDAIYSPAATTLNIECSKTTAGGRVLFTFFVQKTEAYVI